MVNVDSLIAVMQRHFGTEDSTKFVMGLIIGMRNPATVLALMDKFQELDPEGCASAMQSCEEFEEILQ